MKTLGRAIATLLLGVVPFAGSAQAQEGFRVIVNPANPATTLRQTEVSRMFLKKTRSWPTGVPAIAVDQERTAAVRRAFSLKIHSRDPDRIVSYWHTMVFSGREVPPPIKTSDASVLEFVRANPGAIGYVSETADLAGVKVLSLR
jgi:ABC-type phosphate transport system substrate-binding protein